MLWLVGLIGLVAAVAGALYLRSEGTGSAAVGLAALRTVSIGALLILLINPSRTVEGGGGRPTVLLDASLSMGSAGGRWRDAVDTARALAGPDGRLLRFGSRVSSWDTTPPGDGFTYLADALRAASALGGAVYVVTDGEIADWQAISPALATGATYVILPRDTVPDAAIVEAALPHQIQREDSIRVAISLGLWGGIDADSVDIEVSVGGRRLSRYPVAVGSVPGIVQREMIIPPGTLGAGEHALRIRVRAPGDMEPRNDVRIGIVTVSDRPAVTVVVDPADFEGRFLAATVGDVAGASVRGYVRIGGDRWLDAASLARVAAETVVADLERARVVVLRGPRRFRERVNVARALWWWPSGSDTSEGRIPGEWYVTSRLDPSPVAGPLGGIRWGEVAPLTGLIAVDLSQDTWVALKARQGRRGPERPVLLGRDSGGVRELVTAAAGLWRWAFRGGAEREAYRTLVAAGIDWLLAAGGDSPGATLVPRTRVVGRGEALEFRWAGGTPPESLEMRFTGSDSTLTRILRFGGDARARVDLPVGIYAWDLPGRSGFRGTVAVEPYSEEFRPRRPVSAVGGGRPARILEQRRARKRWWLFMLAMLALLGEWTWRQRRGLA